MKYVLLSLALLITTHAHAAIIPVFNTNNTGPNSLRDAINSANNDALPDTIVFNIPGQGPHVISPTFDLPVIMHPLKIKGYTQPGSVIATDTQPATLKIVLDGSLADVNVSGLTVSADNVRIQGLVIRNFKHDGIRLLGDNNFVWGCYLGTKTHGAEPQPNQHFGINIQGDSNQIGGATSAARTIVSGKSERGISISGDNNRVYGSYIGTDITTTVGIGSNGPGVFIEGDNNAVGRAIKGGGNIIAGNDIGIQISSGELNQVYNNIIGLDKTTLLVNGLGNRTGVLIEGNNDGHNEIGGTDLYTGNVISNNVSGIDVENNSNSIKGNHIGTNNNTNIARGNLFHGIRVSGSNNSIGGSLQGAGNVVAANGTGILIEEGTDNEIQRNIIGTNKSVSQTINLGNNTGVYLRGINSGNNLVGGTDPGTANLISNNRYGVFIQSSSNTVQGNWIGSDQTGTQAMGNTQVGVYIGSGEFNTIGGLDSRAGNIISANALGIVIQSDENAVQGNRIGTDVTGTQALGNTENGVLIAGGNSNTIGGSDKAARNIISANGADGILVTRVSPLAPWFDDSPDNNLIRNNFIGTTVHGNNPLENAGSGIKITGGHQNQIGGTDYTHGNLISSNQEHGIWLGTLSAGPDASNVTETVITNNTIGASLNRLNPLSNNGSGIYINSTDNVVIDTKIGGVADELENFIAWNGSDGVTAITGRANSILRNIIVSNTEKAIDLNADGTSSNDIFDSDIGANRTQNYADILSVQPEGQGHRIRALLLAAPGSSSLIEFYATESCDADGQGEGELYLGSVSTGVVSPSGVREVSFLFTQPVPQGYFITSTATSEFSFNNIPTDTSEFSYCVII